MIQRPERPENRVEDKKDRNSRSSGNRWVDAPLPRCWVATRFFGGGNCGDEGDAGDSELRVFGSMLVTLLGRITYPISQSAHTFEAGWFFRLSCLVGYASFLEGNFFCLVVFLPPHEIFAEELIAKPKIIFLPFWNGHGEDCYRYTFKNLWQWRITQPAYSIWAWKWYDIKVDVTRWNESSLWGGSTIPNTIFCFKTFRHGFFIIQFCCFFFCVVIWKFERCPICTSMIYSVAQ